MKKNSVDIQDVSLENSFDVFLKEVVEKQTKNLVVKNLPMYIREGDEFVNYIEETITTVFTKMIECILAEKLGLVKNGKSFKLQNESKHPLAAIVNDIFKEETEKLVKQRTRDIMKITLNEVEESIKNDTEFLNDIKTNVKNYLQNEILKSLQKELNAKSKKMVESAMVEIYKKA
jgi:hypothetical protein